MANDTRISSLLERTRDLKKRRLPPAILDSGQRNDPTDDVVYFCGYVEDLLLALPDAIAEGADTRSSFSVQPAASTVLLQDLNSWVIDLERKMDGLDEHALDVSKEQSSAEDGSDWSKRWDSSARKIRRDINTWINSLAPWGAIVAVSGLTTRSSIDSLQAIQADVEVADGYVGKLIDYDAQAKKLIEKLKDAQTENAIEQAKEGFARRAAIHFRYQISWFIVLLISGASALQITYAVTGIIPNINGTDRIAIFWVKRGVYLIVPLLFMRVSLTKYNQERNLSVIYQHRAIVLKRREDIGLSLRTDESRDAHLLEVAKIIYSDPVTGFTKAPNEVNVSGVFESVRKAASAVAN